MNKILRSSMYWWSNTRNEGLIMNAHLSGSQFIILGLVAFSTKRLYRFHIDLCLSLVQYHWSPRENYMFVETCTLQISRSNRFCNFLKIAKCNFLKITHYFFLRFDTIALPRIGTISYKVVSRSITYWVASISLKPRWFFTRVAYHKFWKTQIMDFLTTILIVYYMELNIEIFCFWLSCVAALEMYLIFSMIIQGNAALFYVDIELQKIRQGSLVKDLKHVSDL